MTDEPTTLTDMEHQVHIALVGLIEEVGYPPTVKELSARVGLKSTASTHDYLRRLAAKGYIRNDGYPRAIVILTPEPS